MLQSDSEALIIAMDHGVVMGPERGLEERWGTVSWIVDGGIDAVLVHKAIARHVITSESGLVHLEASR